MNSSTGHTWKASLLNAPTCVSWGKIPLCRRIHTVCSWKVFLLNGFANASWDCQQLWRSNCTVCKQKASLPCTFLQFRFLLSHFQQMFGSHFQNIPNSPGPQVSPLSWKPKGVDACSFSKLHGRRDRRLQESPCEPLPACGWACVSGGH